MRQKEKLRERRQVEIEDLKGKLGENIAKKERKRLELGTLMSSKNKGIYSLLKEERNWKWSRDKLWQDLELNKKDYW